MDSPLSRDARPAVALSREQVAGLVERSDGVAVAGVAALVAVDVEVAVLAALAILADHVRLALAPAGKVIAPEGQVARVLGHVRPCGWWRF